MEKGGRIDKSMLSRYLSDNDIKNSIFYICGPPGMVKVMQNLVQNEKFGVIVVRQL